jgi:hypothetical protein
VLTPQLAKVMLDVYWERQNLGHRTSHTLLQLALARLQRG